MEKEKIVYRDLITSDIETICKFPQNAQELFFMCPKADYPLTKEQLEYILKDRFDPTVFLSGNEIIVFANFYEVKRSEYCSIGNVIVNPDFRSRGVGTSLIEIMENIGRQKYNIQEAHLSCFNTNTFGLLLYNKLGYLPYGIEKRTNKRNGISALIKLKKRVI